jgi:hypothetical protein
MDEAASKLRMEINSKPKNWMFRSKNHAVEIEALKEKRQNQTKILGLDLVI